jgi:hypothetical protein
MDGGIILDGKTNGKKWSLFLFLKIHLGPWGASRMGI